jgi:hypothetical protein
MHFSTIAQVLAVGLLAATPVVAEPVELTRGVERRHVGGFGSMAASHVNAVRAVEGAILPRRHK